MKTPAKPPQTQLLLEQAARDGRLVALLTGRPHVMQGEYFTWDKLRHLSPPDGLTHEEWWLALKLGRRAVRRDLPLLRDQSAESFHYTLPDTLLEGVEEVSRAASGRIAVSEQVTNPALRDRYIVSSLIEEAITSSQLEGAATSRRVAKDMLREGRPPRDRSERMIANNYRVMSEIRQLQHEDMTPELVCELQRLVTEGTLDNPNGAGRIQRDQAERVSIWGDGNQLLYVPPPVEQLPERLARLCEFANSSGEGGYVPPLLRAFAIHFMVGYDHYFEDGNGRTARALFYWSMLRQGFWLTEFVSISHILREAPAQYARSFLLTEDDEGDLTHFFLYQLDVVRRAIRNLHDYLARKADEIHEVEERLRVRRGDLNHRQLALLRLALREPTARFTAKSHGRSHDVSVVTARHDLQQLEERGLLSRSLIRREAVWTPATDLAQRV